jgi:hypothetical protein
MGFLDRAACLSALRGTGNDVAATVAVLTGPGAAPAPAPAPSPPPRPARTRTPPRSATPLEQLVAMGFTDMEKNRRALSAANDNVQGAIEVLVSGLGL